LDAGAAMHLSYEMPDFDVAHFPPMTDQEMADLILHYLTTLVRTMNRVTLVRYRVNCLTHIPPVDARILVLIELRSIELRAERGCNMEG
jgi:hypothetical protein